jgi:hypothetical protein
MTGALDPVWDRVQDALDARRDPLDDPRVARHLAEHPEAARAYAELVHGLERLVAPAASAPVLVVHGAEDEGRPASRTVRILAAAAALVIALGALALTLLRPAPEDARRADAIGAAPKEPPTSPPPVPLAPAITRYRIEREHQGPSGRAVVVIADGRIGRHTSAERAAGALATTVRRSTYGPSGQEQP